MAAKSPFRSADLSTSHPCFCIEMTARQPTPMRILDNNVYWSRAGAMYCLIDASLVTCTRPLPQNADASHHVCFLAQRSFFSVFSDRLISLLQSTQLTQGCNNEFCSSQHHNQADLDQSQSRNIVHFEWTLRSRLVEMLVSQTVSGSPALRTTTIFKHAQPKPELTPLRFVHRVIFLLHI